MTDVRMIEVAHPYRGPNGALDVIGQDGLPFPVARAFRIAGVPPGAWRGNHAHRTCRQILWSVSGSWRATVEARPGEERIVDLHEGADGIYVPPMHWLRVASCARLGVLVVLCSEPYREEDYVRDYSVWKREAVAR